MNQSRPHSLLLSVLTNLVLFSAIIVAGFPIFNSGDDVYLLYLLGGGFGQPPTELLHYHYIVHPYLGLLIKNLFLQFPNFNWYTAGLYFFHFAACTIFLWQWLRNNKLIPALLGFAVVFFTVEARFLLQPTFTNTAFTTAAGGMLLLYDGLKHYSRPKILLAAALVLVAAMFRMHMLIPVIIIAAPFFLVFINVRRMLVPAASLAVLLVSLIFLQQQYYKQRIRGWEQEENYRKAVIHYYNIPKKQITDWRHTAQLPAYLIEHGMLWDKSSLSEQSIAAATKFAGLNSALQQPEFGERLYWLLMENRLGLIVAVAFFLYLFALMSRKQKIAAIVSALLLSGLCTGLLLFRKLPPYVIPACLLTWIAFTGILGGRETNTSPKRNWVFAVAGVLLLAWAIARAYKLNNWNKSQQQEFACVYKYVSGSPGKLFIAVDDTLPMDYFHVWHTPRTYMLPNVLYKDHFLNNTYQPAYKKFGINSPGQYLDNSAVVFIGKEPAVAYAFYQWPRQQSIKLKPAEKLTDCIGSLYLLKDSASADDAKIH
jgi:hypothetical protein